MLRIPVKEGENIDRALITNKQSIESIINEKSNKIIDEIINEIKGNEAYLALIAEQQTKPPTVPPTVPNLTDEPSLISEENQFDDNKLEGNKRKFVQESTDISTTTKNKKPAPATQPSPAPAPELDLIEMSIDMSAPAPAPAALAPEPAALAPEPAALAPPPQPPQPPADQYSLLEYNFNPFLNSVINQNRWSNDVELAFKNIKDTNIKGKNVGGGKRRTKKRKRKGQHKKTKHK